MEAVRPTIPSVWQVSGGPAARNYAEVFLRYGVALIGPGEPGPWRPDRDDLEFDGSFVRRFATEPATGDIILLRTGQSRIRAVGLVVSGYIYLDQFDDVNGWDLQQGRRVSWTRLPTEYDFGSAVFGANPPRFSKVYQAAVVDYAQRFVQSPPTHWQDAALPELPLREPELQQVPDFLQELVAQVRDLSGLYWSREDFGEHPTEDELVAHYVVPFLKALQWPAECIGIKWKYVDVVTFRSLPRAVETCHYIIEAKRLGQGIEGALEQAKGYIKALGIVRDVVVTDGIRYRFYEAKQDFVPVAYANLAYLKGSALDLFSRMTRPHTGS